MAEIERLTITVPTDMAAVVKGAVADGDYASASEVIRAALRDWKMKRALQLQDWPRSKPISTRGLPTLPLAASRTSTPPASSSEGGSY